MNGLSVVILSRTASNFIQCTAAVRRYEPKLRIILVDDGVSGSHWPDDPFERIGGKKPFIFARNANIGIAAAGQDDVILLNDDALLKDRGGFSLLQRAAEKNPDYGLIGATTNLTGQRLQMRQLPPIGLRQVPSIAFICVLLPRRTLNLVGPLDERYCLDYGVEDRDYCKMVERAGYKIGVHDRCFVDHHPASTHLKSTYRDGPIRYTSNQNKELFDKKWGIRR